MTKNNHAADEQIIGYLYRTLSDAEREVLDDHFLTCPGCRARLSKHEVQQRQIDHELKAAVRQISPSESMSFEDIRKQLPNRLPFGLARLHMETATPIFITVAGIIFAIIGLGQSLAALLATSEPHSPGALPTLAGFFFVFVSVGQLERALAIRPRLVVVAALAGLLWLGTAILGLLNLLVIRDLSIWTFVSLGFTSRQAGAGTILVIGGATILYIAGVIGGAEYHYKHLGQPGSWKLFAWVIAIELLILVVPHFVF